MSGFRKYCDLKLDQLNAFSVLDNKKGHFDRNIISRLSFRIAQFLFGVVQKRTFVKQKGFERFLSIEK